MARTTDLRRVALCGRSLPQVGFEERVRLAADAGFGYVSLLASDLAGVGTGTGLERTATHLRDHGVAVAELDAVVDWLPGTKLPWLRDVPRAGAWARVAETVGATTLNVVDLVEAPPLPDEEAAEAFARVCRAAADVGITASLEFVPFSRVPDLAAAVRIVELAGEANGGVMLDTWHLFRSGATVADVAEVPAERSTGLQVNDAPEEERGARTRQAQQHRLLPGDGVVGVAALLADLDARGCRVPIGLEVTSVELGAVDAAEAVRRLAAAAASVLP